MISEVPRVEGLLQDGDLLIGECDALPHLASVGGPLTDIVLGLPVVPADEVELLGPAFGGFGEDGYPLDDFVFEFDIMLPWA